MELKMLEMDDFIDPGVSEDSEQYFDFVSYALDFAKLNDINLNLDGLEPQDKEISALIPKENQKMIDWVNKHRPISYYILGLIEKDMKENDVA